MTTQLILGISLVAATMPARADLTNGLVAFFPFAGSPNDQSGNHHDGTVTNAALTSDNHGNPDQAYHFNGTNAFITVADSPDLRISNNFTLNFWAKIANVHQSPSYLVNKAIWGIQQWGAHYNYVRNRISFAGSHTPTENLLPSLPADQNWHMFTFACANGAFSAYLDGLTDGQVAHNIHLDPVVGGKVWFGATHYDVGPAISYFSGDLDQIRIYNRALSAADLREILDAESPLHLSIQTAAVRLQWFGQSNVTYLVQSTDDLSTWNTVTNIIGTGSDTNLVDWTDGTTKAYRLRIQP